MKGSILMVSTLLRAMLAATLPAIQLVPLFYKAVQASRECIALTNVEPDRGSHQRFDSAMKFLSSCRV